MNGFVRILSVAFLVARVSGQACIEETLDCNEPVPTIFKLGDQSCACNSAAHAGALKYANGKIYVCLGSKWKIVLLGDEYGTESNPGLSCKDILDKAGQQLSNGVFWIRLRGKSVCCKFCVCAPYKYGDVAILLQCLSCSRHLRV